MAGFGGLGGLGGLPAQEEQPPGGMGGFMQSPGFGNLLQAAGMSLLSSPRNAPLSGLGTNLQAVQTMNLRGQEAEMQRQKMEEEKARRAKLSEYVLSIAPEPLRGVAATDPDGALTIMKQMQSAQVQPVEINGQLVDPVTRQVLGDYRTNEQFKILSPEERASIGIPATDTNIWQRGPDGKIGVAGGSGVTVNNNMSPDKFGDAFGTELGKQQAALIDAGRTAAGNNMRLGKLEQHLATAPQGGQGAFVQFAGNLGIPLEGLDDVQAAQAIINQIVPGMRPPGSGTMSDADLALFKSSTASILNQPGGNAFIIETTKAINDYTIAQAAIAEQIAVGNLTLEEGMAQQRAVPNPLAGFSGAGTATPLQPASAAGPGALVPMQPGAQTSIVNPATGERMVLQNGQWVPAQ